MTDPGFPSFQVGIMAMLVYPPVNHQSYGNSCFSPIGNDLFFAWRVSTKLPKFQPKNITFRMNRQHPSIGIFAETWSMKALSNPKNNTWIWYWNGTSMSTLYICQLPLEKQWTDLLWPGKKPPWISLRYQIRKAILQKICHLSDLPAKEPGNPRAGGWRYNGPRLR